MVGTLYEHDREHHHFPDYSIMFVDDMLIFNSRSTMPALMRGPPAKGAVLVLHPDTTEKAKKVIPGYDVYHVVEQWKTWAAGKTPPNNPDAAFIAFCKEYKKRNPLY